MKYNIVTIKWGDKYSPDDVNRLYHSVRENTNFEVQFYCFTDNPQGLDESIIQYPLPPIQILDEHKHYIYLKEAGLCDDYLGHLKMQRVFFFDLDVVIVGNLDDLFAYPKNDEFVIINDWNTKGNHVGQASMYSWMVGTLGHIKEEYEQRPHEIIQEFGTASQEYLSNRVIQKYGQLIFWPKSWCVSFKQHCLPVWYLRYFKTPVCPEGVKVIAFHGDPKPANAVKGQWSDKKIPWYKKIYKHTKPTVWLNRYLQD
ncbi:MAG: hypothetical protein C0432_01140 [Candidatus Puniceispirillum sp.]|nr:hypothetical protein [Candidatus Pelagibacter sp.]MBA4282887.1 hypothetical protein [Candidatus Puniceispirillum sp.]